MKAQKGGEFMKKRTLIMITAAMITCAAIVLSSSLSLLYAGAFESILDESRTANNENVNVDELIGDGKNVQKSTADETAYAPPVSTKYDYPDFEYDIVNAKEILYCGCEQYNHRSSHYSLLKGVTIDVYSHRTGKLVGQLPIASEEIYNYLKKLSSEAYDSMVMAFDPKSGEDSVNLPKGDYRIEVYVGGEDFSYTYGNNGIFEFIQSGLTFYGGEKLTGYIDFLISMYIAEIEGGTVEAPDPEMAVSKLEYSSYEGYWYGWYFLPGQLSEGRGRWTERFPYLEKE